MLFYGSSDPSADCAYLGYQGICITLGMQALIPKKPSTASA